MMHKWFTLISFFLVPLAFGASGCQSDEDFSPRPCPACPFVERLSRPIAEPLDTIQVIGGNFQRIGEGAQDRVTVGGVEVTVLEVTEDVITIVIPFDARTGTVVVCAANATNPNSEVRNTLCSDYEGLVARGYEEITLIVECPNSFEDVLETINARPGHGVVGFELINQTVGIAAIAVSGNRSTLIIRTFNPEGRPISNEALPIDRLEEIHSAVGTDDGGFVIISGDRENIYFRRFAADNTLEASSELLGEMIVNGITEVVDGFVLSTMRIGSSSKEGSVLKTDRDGRLINNWSGNGQVGIAISPLEASNWDSSAFTQCMVSFERTNGSMLLLSNQYQANLDVSPQSKILYSTVTRQGILSPSRELFSGTLLIDAKKISAEVDHYILLCKRAEGPDTEYFTVVINENGDLVGELITVGLFPNEDTEFRAIMEFSEGGFLIMGETDDQLSDGARGSILLLIDEERQPLPGRRRSINRFDVNGRSVFPQTILQLNSGLIFICGYASGGATQTYIGVIDCI